MTRDLTSPRLLLTVAGVGSRRPAERIGTAPLVTRLAYEVAESKPFTRKQLPAAVREAIE